MALVLTGGCRDRMPDERVGWRADPLGLLFFTLFVVTTLLALEQAQHIDLAAMPLAGAPVRRRHHGRCGCWCGRRTARRRR